jgi:uncharacterized protein involved in exopolysaccharide biosynthesis
MTTKSPRSTSGSLFLRTITRRWAFILVATGALCGLATWAGYPWIQPTYRATSLLRIEPEDVDLFGLKDKGKDDLASFQETQIQLLKSPNVLTSAATNPRIARLPWVAGSTDAVAELRKVVDARALTGTYLAEVAVNSKVPAEASNVVNAVVDAYLESNAEWSEGMTRTQIQKLEDYLKDLDTQSEDIERRWRDFAAKGDVDLNAPGKAADQGFPDTKEKAERKSQIAADPYREIQAELLHNEIDRLKAQARLEAYKGSSNPSKGQVEELEIQIKAANLLETALREKLASVEVVRPKSAKDEVEITLLTDEHSRIRAMREMVQRRLEQLKFDAKGHARIRLVSNAVPPGKPIDGGLRNTALIALPFIALVPCFLAGLTLEARSLTGFKV